MSRNLVYISIFYNTDYILLFELLLGSIHRFGGLDTHTDLLVLTHPSLEKEIQNYLAFKNMYAYFYFLDFTTLFHSAIARLFLFEWEHISNYITILYLDTDILINGSLSDIFAVSIEQGILYALEEGQIGDSFWGGDLFDFSVWDPKKTGFTSGVLLFKNTYEIQSLFVKIVEHIHKDIFIEKKPVPATLEQSYIIYHAYTENRYNTQLLKKYVENNAKYPEDKIIYHFPGGPGGFSNKYLKMLEFLKNFYLK